MAAVALSAGDPGVLHDLWQRPAAGGVLHEQARNEVLCAVGEEGGELEVDFGDAAVGLAVAVGLEGRVADEELVAEDAEGPDVHRLVVGLALHHLGGEVVEGAAEGVALGGGGVNGPSEVCDLDLALAVDEEVLGLDVAVDDVFLVAVVEGRGEGADVVGRPLLREAFQALEVLVEFAPRGELEDEVDSTLVVKVPIESKDVVVSKMGLDLDLATKLVLHTGFRKLRLEQNFEGYNIVTLFLPRQVNVPELSSSERFPNVEI